MTGSILASFSRGSFSRGKRFGVSNLFAGVYDRSGLGGTSRKLRDVRFSQHWRRPISSNVLFWRDFWRAIFQRPRRDHALGFLFRRYISAPGLMAESLVNVVVYLDHDHKPL
jgi:hypothetical protein